MKITLNDYSRHSDFYHINIITIHKASFYESGNLIQIQYIKNNKRYKKNIKNKYFNNINIMDLFYINKELKSSRYNICIFKYILLSLLLILFH